MNKVVTIVAILAIIFLAGILIFGGDGEQNVATGSVYIGVTDAAADMGQISEITLSAERVQFHSETEGWVDATTNGEEFDLLTLNANDQTKLWAEADVAAGTYDQVRMTVSSVEVVGTDGTTTQAILAANDITMTSDVVVEGDANSSVVFDVQVDESIHTASEGTYVFAPVVVMENRNNIEASVDQNNNLTIESGAVASAITVGVDLSGESRANFKVSPNTVIELNASGIIMTDEEESSDDTNDGGSAESEAGVDVEAGDGEAEAGVDGEVEL